jgi:hypothetical protein
MIRYENTYSCIFYDGKEKQQFSCLEHAMNFAALYVGNNSYNKPFSEEHTYLFGPGNGDTTVMVRRDVTFIREN